MPKKKKKKKKELIGCQKKKKRRKLKISIYLGYRKLSIIFLRTDWMPEKNWLDAKKENWRFVNIGAIENY